MTWTRKKPACIRCGNVFERGTEDTSVIAFGRLYCAPCIDIRRKENERSGVDMTPIVEVKP